MYNKKATMKDFFDPKLKKAVKPKKGKKQLIFYNPSKIRTFVFGLGTGAVILCLGYLTYLWLPLARAMAGYHWQRVDVGTSRDLSLRGNPTPTLTPTPMPIPEVPDDWPVINKDFSVYIPKLESSAQVFPNIDPGKPEIYQEVLKDGVAHAAGSGLPGSTKPVFLFAHSTNAEWNVVRYNAVFFLLNKLEPGDEVHLVYQNRPYTYQIFDKKIVGAKDISYLTDYQPGREEIILQTCWPPGTILKRLLVFGKLKE
jgi:LPXTG-site transpeptidase (sortase) family protein